MKIGPPVLEKIFEGFLPYDMKFTVQEFLLHRDLLGVPIFHIMEKENPSLVFSGDREIPTRGSTVPVGNEASPSFPPERWTRGLGFPGFTVHQ